MKTRAGIEVLLCAAIALYGCEKTHIIDVPLGPSSAQKELGAAGGDLSAAGATLLVPAGALSTPTQIAVTTTEESPLGFNARSPLFRFEPEGLRFSQPVTIRIPVRGDPETATIFWSRYGDDTYTALPTRVEGGFAIAQSTHFSSAFLGDACQGGDCCTRATNKLDVLFLVDNSNSMAEEQAALAEQLPRMIEGFASGDPDRDGVQDFPAIDSIQAGIITSDMGVGGFSVPTCTANPTYGDDGVLRTIGNTSIDGCEAFYPSGILQYSTGGSETPAEFASRFSCIARTGTGGCGFEQQLEAVFKAVQPAERTTTPPFVNNTQGHGGPAGGVGANAGFIREDSVVALILVTDEEDCSLADPRLADTMGSVYTGNLNLRCYNYKDAQHAVSRYVTGLRSVVSDPNRIVFAGIVGVPQDLVADPEAIDYEAVLADPRMRETLDVSADRLVPSCTTENGVAFPPRRIVEVARGFGGNGVIQSICASDFGPAVHAILSRVADRAAGICAD